MIDSSDSLDSPEPGAAASELFLELTPDKVLDAVERSGVETRPVCYPLNSFENRVYEVELADRTRVVAKFYRPGRWSQQQILEEHRLLAELHAEELPVAPPLPFRDSAGDATAGPTLQTIDGIFYALWERKAGRAPDELTDHIAHRLGVFTGRMHVVAARSSFEHRPRLDADYYVRRQLSFLERGRFIPRYLEARYMRAAEAIAAVADRELAGVEYIRLHGDLHLGNVLLRDGALRVIDLDDACLGPPVQDVWLALPGRDAHALRLRESFLEGYESFRAFERSSLSLIEVLRGLRLVRYCGWLARRHDDPAFRLGWPDFGSEEYWQRETGDLEEQVRCIETRQADRRQAGSRSYGGSQVATDPGQAKDAGEATELTQRDYFWDWQGD